jgi:hypothetical protein
MVLFIACCAVTAFLCGLLILHWAPLVPISVVTNIVIFLGMPWDRLLIPKWIALLTAIILAWISGVVSRFLLDEAGKGAWLKTRKSNGEEIADRGRGTGHRRCSTG